MSQRYQGGFITASYNGLKVPDAPTIGTATGGNASASVTFTAPSNVGGGAITSYTVISSPGGITGTGASSPVTVSGLTNGTAYTFTVVATNAYGTGPASAASNSVTPVLAIGDAFGGGYYAGQISTAGNGIADYNLVVAPKSSGETTATTFKTSNTDDAGATSEINGPSNSASMNDSDHPAVQFCEGLTIGGFTDWYLPSRNELEVCYYNLKTTTTDNVTNSGINANAVPARASNYTTSNPAQTSSTAFRTSGSQAFITGSNQFYWTSTQGSSTNAWVNFFDTGNQDPPSGKQKGNSFNVRAVRRVPV